MAHFVKLGKGNIVIQGIVVHNDVATSEQAGIDFINNLYGTNDIWKQTFSRNSCVAFVVIGKSSFACFTLG